MYWCWQGRFLHKLPQSRLTRTTIRLAVDCGQWETFIYLLDSSRPSLTLTLRRQFSARGKYPITAHEINRKHPDGHKKKVDDKCLKLFPFSLISEYLVYFLSVFFTTNSLLVLLFSPLDLHRIRHRNPALHAVSGSGFKRDRVRGSVLMMSV